MFRLSYIALPLMSLAFILAGCASGQYDKITEVDHKTSMLRVNGNAQKGVTPRRVAFADPWEYEEYAGLIGNGHVLKSLYSQRRHPNCTRIHRQPPQNDQYLAI